MEEDVLEELGPSRSAKKRAAKQVEELAVQLAELGEAQRAQLPVSDGLRREISRAAQTRGRGAHKRQLKFLAGLLRRSEEETEALRSHMAGVHEDQLAEKEGFHLLEELRDRLCDPKLFGVALEDLRERFPGLDHKQVGRLARSVHNTGDKKAFREIFRKLRDAG